MDDLVGFKIRSSIAFEPPTVNVGSKLKIIISDWEDHYQEIAAVRIGGQSAYVTGVEEYENCFQYADAYYADSNRIIYLEVKVPLGVPPGEQTVSVYDHEQLEHIDSNGESIPDKKSCQDLTATERMGSATGSAVTARLKGQPIAIAAETIEITTKALSLSQSEAVRGQKITITGSGFNRAPQGQDDIKTVSINGQSVDTDLSRLEVGANGEVAVTITVPTEARTGDNEVRVIGWDDTLGQANLKVPEASLTLDPAESRRGTDVLVTGSGFIADKLVLVTYGDGGDLSNGDDYAGHDHADAKGNITLSFPVPLTAQIGALYKVIAVVETTANGEPLQVRAEADHTIPSGGLTVTPVSVLPGDTITIRSENLPAFALVRPVQIGGRDVTPIPNPYTDMNGALEIEVTVPPLEMGEQTVRIEASGVVLTQIIEIAEPPFSGPPSAVFRELIGAGVLLRVWRLDPSYQGWNIFDPRPDFADLNTLTEVNSGDLVLINLNEPYAFQGDALEVGWNIVFLK